MPESDNTFYVTSDENVNLVMIGGKPIYGEKTYLDSFDTSGQLIPSENEKLKNKCIYWPKEWDTGSDLAALLEGLNEMLEEAGTEQSKFRASEDEDYREEIAGLEEKFTGR